MVKTHFAMLQTLLMKNYFVMFISNLLKNSLNSNTLFKQGGVFLIKNRFFEISHFPTEYNIFRALFLIGYHGDYLLLIYIIKAVCNYVVGYLGHVVGVRMQRDMRRDLFVKYESLPTSYYDENKTGDLLSRLVNDLFDVSELAHHGPENVFLSILMLIGSFIILSSIYLPLALVMYSIIPIIVQVFRTISAKHYFLEFYDDKIVIKSGWLNTKKKQMTFMGVTAVSVEKSVTYLKEGNVPYEFRTTVVKNFHTEEEFEKIPFLFRFYSLF